MFKKKKKLHSKVKYQSAQFKSKLARARTYQRNPGGWSKCIRVIRSWRWSFRSWLIACVILGLFFAGLYVTFYPNWLFVRTIQVVGTRTALEHELQGQVDRYLTQRTYFIPHRNLLFLRTPDLQAYVLTVNPGVWRVDEVQKRWPHTLIVRVTPRDPAFTVLTNGGTWLVSNDGLTLPVPSESTNTLSVVAVGLRNPELGKSYFTDNLLSTLTAVKQDFAALTGLPNPAQVVLKPVVLDMHPQPTVVPGTIPPATVATNSIEPHSVNPVVSDLMPEEVLVRVPAGGVTSAFSVLLQVGNSLDEVFRQLHVLLSKQSTDRLQHLAYIDMRFSGKAFICLQDTPCAKSVELNVVGSPTPAQN